MQPPTCANCTAPLNGPYCSRCGQKQRTARLTLPTLARNVLDQAFSLDRGLLRTAWTLAYVPNRVVRDYLAGRTVAYTSPIKYFVLWLTVAQLVSLWTGALDNVAAGFLESFSRARPMGADVDDVSALISRYYVAGGAALVPLLTVWTRLFFRRAGYTLAEHAVFHLYLGGQGALLLTVAIPFEQYPVVFGGLMLAGLAAYLWHGAGFFGARRLYGIAGMILALMLALFGFLLVLTLLLTL